MRDVAAGRTCDGWEEDGDEAEKDVAARHGR